MLATTGNPSFDISIIMPVFNTGDYLEETLNSLINQNDPPRFEIILIDDASSDHSLVIAHRFRDLYPEQIHVEALSSNQGVSVCRNKGVALARGTYFTFVDGDDLVPPHALRHLFDAAERYQVDIVKGNHTLFNNEWRKLSKQNVRSLRFLFGDDILRRFYQHDLFRGYTWGKLLRTSTFQHLQHEPGVRMAQDSLYFAEALGQARSMALIPQHVYDYRVRESSATQRKFESNTYLWWLYCVDKAGRFSRTRAQRCAYHQWQLRTLTQIAREARSLSGGKAAEVSAEIERRLNMGHFESPWHALKVTRSLRWTWHFLRLQHYLKQLQTQAS